MCYKSYTCINNSFRRLMTDDMLILYVYELESLLELLSFEK